MARKKRIVGAHLAPEDPLSEAGALGADCVQIFLSNPQGWKKPPARADADELRASKMPLYVHAPYLINVCSPRNNVRYGSRKILQQTCDAAAAVGATAVIVHPGHAEDGIDAGIGRWGRTLEMLASGVPLYIENTAGGDNAVARRFNALARLWEVVTEWRGDIEIRFCFDTRHGPRALWGGAPRGAWPHRVAFLLRPLPPPRRGRGARRRGGARAGDRRAYRPPSCERLPRPAGPRGRPPRQPREGHDGRRRPRR